jgi:hypothetical protein
MVEIGNKNIMTTRVDPDRLKLVKKTRKRGEGDSAYLRRAIDALAREKGIVVDNKVVRS